MIKTFIRPVLVVLLENISQATHVRKFLVYTRLTSIRQTASSKNILYITTFQKLYSKHKNVNPSKDFKCAIIRHFYSIRKVNTTLRNEVHYDTKPFLSL